MIAALSRHFRAAALLAAFAALVGAVVLLWAMCGVGAACYGAAR